jgi:YD repeat-containing protein
MVRKIFATGAGLLWVLGAAAWPAPRDIRWTEGVPNPVTGDPGFGDGRTYYASVLWDASAGKYRIWFDSSSGADIGYGESVGDDPTKFGNYQRITGPDPKSSKCHVVQLGPNAFRIWYAAPGGTPGYAIRTATSPDGVNWTEDVECTGIVRIDADSKGPNEHFAVCRKLDGTFYALARTDTTEEADVRDAAMNAYTSTNGVAWTLQGPVEISANDITTIVDHPDRPGTMYAFGYSGDGNSTSHLSTDGGKTWADDEETINTVGASATHPWNQDRNYNPQAIYRGGGRWVLFRTVAEPKRTAYATGVESGIPARP